MVERIGSIKSLKSGFEYDFIKLKILMQRSIKLLLIIVTNCFLFINANAQTSLKHLNGNPINAIIIGTPLVHY